MGITYPGGINLSGSEEDSGIQFGGGAISAVDAAIAAYQSNVVSAGGTLSQTEIDAHRNFYNNLSAAFSLTNWEVYTHSGSNLAASKVKFLYRSGGTTALVSDGSSAFVSGDYSQSTGLTGQSNKRYTTGCDGTLYSATAISLVQYVKNNVPALQFGTIGKGDDSGVSFGTLNLIPASSGSRFNSKGSSGTENHTTQGNPTYFQWKTDGLYIGVGDTVGTKLYFEGERISHRDRPGTGTFPAGELKCCRELSNGATRGIVSVEMIIPVALTPTQVSTLTNIIKVFEAERGRSIPSTNTNVTLQYRGDSLTFGDNTDGLATPPIAWPTALETTRSWNVSTAATSTGKNGGVSGSRIEDNYAIALLNNDDMHMANAVRNIIMYWGGSNNHFINPATESAATTFGRLVTLFTLYKTNGYKVIVGTLAPENASANYNAKITTYNNLILNDTGGSGGANRFTNGELADGIAQCHALTELSDHTDTTYFMSDGIHMKTPAYAAVATCFNNVLVSLGW
jgi:hypothetical protein